MNIRHSLACAAFALAAGQASAAAADLTVYTYESFISSWGPGPELKTRFEAQCGCTLEFVGVEDGVALLNRVRLEGANTRADVIVGLDDSLIKDVRTHGLVQPHSVDFASIPMVAALAWADDSFVPFDFGYFAFIYDHQKIGAPVDSLAALIDGNARVIYQDPRTSTPGLGLLHWVRAVYGDEAPAAWTRLARHTVTVTSGWSEAYNMFLQGEADYVLSYTTSPAYHIVSDGTDRYRAAHFAEGHVAQVEVAALSAHTDNPALANRFLAFLLSREAQEIIPVTNWMLPVRDDVKLPEAFDRLIRPARIGFSADEIGASRSIWVREWREAVSR
ncbi:MAG: thiamine ABC transporter substrate binding subunit [Zoogloeaceae bacterium]|nr:thiamine ABC transporter substrate binding subunit [Zoogloeaceae bacterium]